MPSPFPGMDPYLEGSHWLSLHTQLCAEIARQLAPRLRPKYVALTNKRFVLDNAEDIVIAPLGIYPDTGVVQRTAGTVAQSPLSVSTAPLQLATVMPERVPQVGVEIRDSAKRRLVTAIEVLSPVNKRGQGRKEYLRKRRSIMLSDAHLIEIDLLREGRRVPMRQSLPSVPYFVFVGRAEKRPIVDVWPITLHEKLPTIPVPLLPGDADSFLDLQNALATVYDVIGYDLILEYANRPEIPLPPETVAWAEARVRSWRGPEQAG